MLLVLVDIVNIVVVVYKSDVADIFNGSFLLSVEYGNILENHVRPVMKYYQN